MSLKKLEVKEAISILRGNPCTEKINPEDLVEEEDFYAPNNPPITKTGMQIMSKKFLEKKSEELKIRQENLDFISTLITGNPKPTF